MTSEKSKARVTVSENGPYMVTGDIPLAKQTIMTNAEDGSEAWQEGPAVAHRQTYTLCRCGASQTKPFCDGSHLKIGFVGTETASGDAYLDHANLLNGPILQLTDAESLFAFGRFCDPNGSVWSQVAQTDDRGVRTMFVRQVNECPSGRLVAWDKTSGKPVEHALPVSIGLIEDPEQQCSGPLWLRGGIPAVAADRFEYEVRNRVTLCRCGESKNKPFCDGTHAAIKFSDS
ncbi:CDGSH iron-sulfur domain-containing protein [Bradyrhizobium sp. 41S5]|uniref:CDGSH iron-sulfur domain-containing protein n=1 Tax=Bradyrhizobium sp. 41S5 TaxID=1404443 RepID=UPI00156B0FD0|nr:CDGSH iron-sulfur domain-containing protein [Bradyrhizobium sp. 41S5]UFX47546.1 CDGSH iron-sulfur domain-containing protein [Bradyrhizobium sp. 41S5]